MGADVDGVVALLLLLLLDETVGADVDGVVARRVAAASIEMRRDEEAR